MDSYQVPEWQERSALLLGEETLGRLTKRRVAIIGLGGVGAYAAEMIVRCGVGKVLLLDCDVVTPSNKNRQLLALESNIGLSKTLLMKKRALDINPLLEVEKLDLFLNEDNVAQLLNRYELDYIVDAIDTLSPKVALIQYALKRGVPIVSSMGAGAKRDATKIRVSDISKSFNCPLAYALRKRLRKVDIKRGFKVVFSEELPDTNAIVEIEEQNKKSQVGTISYLPAVFGSIAAQVVLDYLISNDF